MKSIEGLQLKVEALEKKATLMRSTVALSDHPMWTEYVKGLQGYMIARNNQLLSEIDRDESLDVADRRRACLVAEVRLLDLLIRAPERFRESLEAITAQIAEDKAQLEALERERASAKKGAKKYG